MNNKTIGYVLLVIGIVVGLGALLADPLSLGSSTDEFGGLQLIGLIVGIVLIVGGAYLSFVQPGQTPHSQAR